MEVVEAKLPILRVLVLESAAMVTEPAAGVVKLALGSCTVPISEFALTLAVPEPMLTLIKPLPPSALTVPVVELVKLTVPAVPEVVPLKLTLPAVEVRVEPEPMLTLSALPVALL